MGKFDSSKTRVVPVFDRLMRMDPTGRAWLSSPLQLGSHSAAAKLLPDPGTLISGHPAWLGANERALEPPRSLLEWLVKNIGEEAVAEWLCGPGRDAQRGVGASVCRAAGPRSSRRQPATPD
jgi:hypothetical protein